MYVVQYRCTYREYWYDHSDWDDYISAISTANQLAGTGRAVRVVTVHGQVLAQS